MIKTVKRKGVIIMKKFLLFIVSAILALCICFSGCGVADEIADGNTDSAMETTVETVSEEEITATLPETTITAKETTEDFTITTENGAYSVDGDIYTITSAGTYTLTGYLQGQILVNAGDDDDITIELKGATIKYAYDSPIKILSADSVDISAKADTENVIADERIVGGTYASGAGKGAIYAKADLKLKGTGTLVITGNYNNGVHTTKDLTIQKLTLGVSAYNNALKGNDSIKIISGTVQAISTCGDGIKTENTDADKSGNTRGDITFSGGTIQVWAAGDGVSAAHNFVMEEGSSGGATVAVYTGAYSTYTSSSSTEDSFKGIKVENELNISAGAIVIKSYDDGLHANYGTAFDAGGSGIGNINISGGTIIITVYSPEKTTAGGETPPTGGAGGGPFRPNGRFSASTFVQTAVKGADGIHADNTLTVSGGTVKIDSSYEGLEANHIVISGGTTFVAGNDDGVNAAKKINETPTILVSGGYLDVSVSPNGDTDGIDSNGNYTQTGGIVITRGPNSEMAAAIDADGTVSISAGTLIVLGYGNVRTGGSVNTYSISLNSAGSHTITVGGTQYTFTNAYSYGRTTCYSSVSISA